MTTSKPKEILLPVFLRKKGFGVSSAGGFNEAVEAVKTSYFDLVITDFQMPDGTGYDLLKEIKSYNPAIAVIIITAYGTIDTAVSAMRDGAFDYIQKPVNLNELLFKIESIREKQFLISENSMLKAALAKKYSFDSIVSQSGEMEEALSTAARVAKSKAAVMILGESGTGKELIARALHVASERNQQPFIIVNCAALPETLFESELFGHEKGAFTGASKTRLGLFEQANGGTLFIDEVGDIPLAIQVKLLRAVQFGEITRLGAEKPIKTDVRIVTATNRNLEQMIAEGSFREDLYYRFNVVSIKLPPLRKRKTDVPLLTDHFINKYNEINGTQIKGISKEALQALMCYDFPGNIRELENIIQRAVVMARGEFITQRDLPNLNCSSNLSAENPFDSIQISDMNIAAENLEKAMIQKALDQTSGNQSKAAELLNITERMIRYKISKYSLKF